jgi:hypothetical protein
MDNLSIKRIHIGILSFENRITPENHHASITSSFPRYVPPIHPKPKKCVYCKKEHSSNECTTSKDCSKRWAMVKEQKICFNCLGHHKSSACLSKFRCRSCKGKHHASLCNEGRPKPEIPSQAANVTGNTSGTVVHTTMTPIPP